MIIKKINLPTNQGSYEGSKTTTRTGAKLCINAYLLFLIGLLFEKISKINAQKVTIGKIARHY